MPTRIPYILVVLFCISSSFASADPLGAIKVTTDRAPDCSSLKAIVDSVTRGCKTDDARVIALYNFCRYDHYHHAYPSEHRGVSALKFINVYGWGLCGGQHTVQAALWDAAGYPWRFRGWSGHTTVEVKYGGRWHYLDTFLKFYTWMPDPRNPGRKTIAGQEDILADPSLVSDMFSLDPTRRVWYLKNDELGYVGDKVHTGCSSFLVCGDSLPGVISGIKTSRNSGSPRGWGGIRFDDPEYNTDVNLGCGYSLSLDWNKVDDGWYFRGRDQGPRHTCGDKDYRNCAAIGPLLEPYSREKMRRTWSNGTLVFRPDFSNDACLASLKEIENVALEGGRLVPAEDGKPGRFIVEMSSPYVVSKATARIEGADASIEIATDTSLRDFTPLAADKLSEKSRGTYAYAVQVSFTKPISKLEFTSLVQHNQEALPYLAPGINKVTVAVANPRQLRRTPLVVTYAYCLGSREPTPEQMFDRDAELYRAHWAQWSEKPIVVRHVIDRSPYTFEIPIPTPNGKQPVYPRMLYLRREVLAVGRPARPTAAASTTARVGPEEYLANVPVPWLIGTTPPKPRPKRRTKTIILPIRSHLYCSKSGAVIKHQSLEWLKDSSQARVLLMDFDVAKLLDAKRLAGAKLVINVDKADNRAPLQASATALAGPLETNSSFDFSKLGPTVGWTVVAKGDGPGKSLQPVRQYEIDVTRAVRSWCRGKPAHGFGLRVTPNRAVDDGWTVRFTPLEQKPAEMQIEFYVD